MKLQAFAQRCGLLGEHKVYITALLKSGVVEVFRGLGFVRPHVAFRGLPGAQGGVCFDQKMPQGRELLRFWDVRNRVRLAAQIKVVQASIRITPGNLQGGCRRTELDAVIRFHSTNLRGFYLLQEFYQLAFRPAAIVTSIHAWLADECAVAAVFSIKKRDI